MSAVVDDFRAAVPAFMRTHHVPGAAFALVDTQGILWAEGFGRADHRKPVPVRPATPFLVMSVSKTLTATALLLAAQDGVVDLDAPLTTYLPGWTFRSRYEANPERKMTLRHLLSHTAGLQSEAPVGNSAEPVGNFADHVRSIQDTWLRFPVGQGSSYSNIGVDLAAYILQNASGMSVEEYLERRLFQPLGMDQSSVGTMRANGSLPVASGHSIGLIRTEHPGPMLGAAGLRSSVADLARFVQWQLNRGTFPAGCRLAPSWFETMQTAYAIKSGDEPDTYFGLGVQLRSRPIRSDEPAVLCVYHTGGGGGSSSLIYWYPEWGIGGIALANRHPLASLDEFALRLPIRLVRQGVIARRHPGSWAPGPHCVSYERDAASSRLPTPERAGWGAYRGTYRLKLAGYEFRWYARLAMGLGVSAVTPAITVHAKGGGLFISESRFMQHFFGARLLEAPLQAVDPGLFFTAAGDCLDFTGPVPSFNNLRLEKR